ncbi:MAG TPA: hypothetical protein VNY05_13900 [Candidatus Acidoferrales bacterium]|jgi:hypothetical protein|nr:hypothetical protein [Candidatus Acidoferrales bacterium]
MARVKRGLGDRRHNPIVPLWPGQNVESRVLQLARTIAAVMVAGKAHALLLAEKSGARLTLKAS